MIDRITVTPDPASPGTEITVCYSFNGATSPVTLKLNYGPDGTPDESITVSAAAPCKKVTVPNGATSLIVEDQSGQSADHVVQIT